MKNIDKIRQMTADEWSKHASEDEHLIPTLCFMCVGCEECAEQCSKGIFEWLDQESEE